MADKKLDITGVVCPFCVLKVKNAMEQIVSGDTLTILSDHPPAAKDSIPAFAEMNGWKCSVHESAPGLWELTIRK
ncbi:sulfurtransferase TusA family protein [uncultured Methanospirillum sp.]|uniref:sulfurtransferase TusA family protein n=1 Tax=uncultured Methanospirillum sp. TaxID=262503 RepID=UPI0029C91A99|nr:sulfurtransferase TusA family protein [uncultured Methanospirillum sp.]